MALRVPEAVALKRRERLRKQAHKKGRTVSATSLALCGWTLYLTNVPVTWASAAEVSGWVNSGLDLSALETAFAGSADFFSNS